MGKFFLKNDFNLNKPKKIDVKELTSEKLSDTNFFSNIGNMFTGSTSSASGITESVITPGIRFLNFASNIMKLYKNLQYNFNQVQNKIKKIEEVVSAYSDGNFRHVRNSIVKKSSKF